MNLSDATMNCQPPSCKADAPQGVPFFGHLLVSVSHHWRRVLEMRLAELGLTDATWRPLFHLHQAGQALSLKQLAQRMGLDSSSRCAWWTCWKTGAWCCGSPMRPIAAASNCC